jgi:hypothetical protein
MMYEQAKNTCVFNLLSTVIGLIVLLAIVASIGYSAGYADGAKYQSGFSCKQCFERNLSDITLGD